MNIKDVDYILEASKYQSITQAAKSLYISQSALSRYIINLEKRLGIKLFSRLGNKLVPTYAGERYIARAKEISAIKDMLNTELTDIIAKGRGRIRIAFPVIRGSHILPYVVPEFKKEYSNTEIIVVEEDAHSLEELLLSGEIDIAIVHLPIVSHYITYEYIRKEYLLMLVPENNIQATKGKKIQGYNYPWIDIGLFKEEEFILTHPKQRTRQICDELFKKERINPKVILSTENIETAIKLASKGVGISFAPETFLNNLNLVEEPKAFLIGYPPITSDLVIAYRKDAYLSKATKRFMEIVKGSLAGK